METSSQKRSAAIDHDNPYSHTMHQMTKKKKKTTTTTTTTTINASSSSFDFDESPVAGTRITDWQEYEKWKEVRGDIEPTMNYVEVTPEAVEELRKIKNVIGDYVCQLCKVKYENAFALAMHKCPRVVHIEFRCPECDKTFNCPANLASHRRWHKPQVSAVANQSVASLPSIRASMKSKRPQCSSPSESRSTNTSSSTISDTVHEYPSSVSSSTLMSLPKRDLSFVDGTLRRAADHAFTAMPRESASRILPVSCQPFPASFMKQPMLFAQHRPLPLSVPSSFDLRRLQSSCIFCQQQFSELGHLLQHIRKTHAVASVTKSQNCTLTTLDKIVF